MFLSRCAQRCCAQCRNSFDMSYGLVRLFSYEFENVCTRVCMYTKPTFVVILCDEEPLNVNIALSAQIESCVVIHAHRSIAIATVYFLHE